MSQKIQDEEKHNSDRNDVHLPAKQNKINLNKNKDFWQKVFKNRKIIIILSGIIVVVAFIVLMVTIMRPSSGLDNLKIDYHSISANIVQEDAYAVKYYIDFDNKNSLGERLYSRKSSFLKYFIDSKNTIYEKWNGLISTLWQSKDDEKWQKSDSMYKYEYSPTYIMHQFLDILKCSDGELIGKNGDMLIYKVTTISDDELLFNAIESLLVFGDARYENNFGGIDAKVYMRTDGSIFKVIVKPNPVKKDFVLNSSNESFYESDYNEIVIDFYDINATKVDYADELWNVL